MLSTLLTTFVLLYVVHSLVVPVVTAASVLRRGRSEFDFSQNSHVEFRAGNIRPLELLLSFLLLGLFFQDLPRFHLPPSRVHMVNRPLFAAS
jgi:hypothetical protein